MSFERHRVSSQRQFDCLFNHLVRLTSKTTSKFSITGPLWVEYIQQFPHKGSVLEWRQISVMSNHRRLDYSFNSLSRLITKDKSKLCISGSLWGESGDRWIPSEKAGNSRSVFVHTNNTSTTIASIILVYILHTCALRVFGTGISDTDLRHHRSCNVIAMIHNVWNMALS